MKSIVFLKQVPRDMEVKFKQDHTLDREKIVKIMNPADKCALFHALWLKEKLGGKVTAVSMGASAAEEILREAAAFGADECVLLSDAAFSGADTFATAKVLARAVQMLGADLIFCGRRAIDGETGQVGPEVAALLGRACITNVSAFRPEQEKIILERLTDKRLEIVEVSVPAVFSVVENLDITRMPSLAGLRKARQVEVLRFGARELSLSPEECGMKGSKTRVVRLFLNPSGRREAKKIAEAELGAREIYSLLKKGEQA